MTPARKRVTKRAAAKKFPARKAVAKKVAAKTRAPAKTIDLRKERKALYTARPGKPAIVDAGTTAVLALDGEGHPRIAKPRFEDAVAALFSIAYGIKVERRKAGRGPDFLVPNLEAVWWVDGDQPMSASTDPADWRWTVMVAMPDFLKASDLKVATKKAAASADAPLTQKVALRRFKEGKSVQLLHVGPYDKESETIAQMHAFAAANGLKVRGKHHEIYLSDPQRTAPEKLKTILRLGVM
ncbi:MAG: hypothetical protein FJX64_09230 [Alphaproteobacteria bacterium]|nr:hypothetical protein [Alphaproteobacteria bacterium]